MLGNLCMRFHMNLQYITYVCVTVRWARVEGRGLLLRDLLNFAVQLAGGGLVEFYAVGQTTCLYGVQETKRPDTIHISGVLGQLEGDLRQGERGKEREKLLTFPPFINTNSVILFNVDFRKEL